MALRNFKAEQPHQHALYYTSYLLQELAWHKDELLQAMEGDYCITLKPELSLLANSKWRTLVNADIPVDQIVFGVFRDLVLVSIGVKAIKRSNICQTSWMMMFDGGF